MQVQSPEQRSVEEQYIEGAARLLREYGHCKHALVETDEGPSSDYLSKRARKFCVGGALLRAAGGRHVDTLSLSIRLGFEAWGDMVTWNNQPERTKQEVIERLESCL